MYKQILSSVLSVCRSKEIILKSSKYVKNTLKYLAIVVLVYSCSNGPVEKNSNSSINITVDMSKDMGSIRPMNGGNYGVISNYKMLDLTEHYKELKIPFARLHDVPWRDSYAVDIHTIFSDFSKDPSAEASYDFRATDAYVKALVDAGIGIVFRLGESIEWTKQKLHVNPPDDYERWTEVCSYIIKHYNYGWNNGFQYDIEYWEIWNEPDFRPMCWTGNDEQFILLYKTAATTLKAEFPNLKFGGPAFAHPLNSENQPKSFTEKFLTSVKNQNIPLDFFTWHSYSISPWTIANIAKGVRQMLDKYGLDKTESYINEWNYLPIEDFSYMMKKQGLQRQQWYNDQTGSKGAAFVVNAMLLFQNSGLDGANFFTTTAGLLGIYNTYGVPFKVYYGFKAYSKLLETPLLVETNYNEQDSLVVSATSSINKKELTVLISNFTDTPKKINLNLMNTSWEDKIKCDYYIVDKVHDLEKIEEKSLLKSKDEKYNIHYELKGSSVLLLKIISPTNN